MLNRPSSDKNNAINRLPQVECNVLLDEFPTVTETRKALQHLSSGKAPGADAIPAKFYKAGPPMAEKKLTELFQFHNSPIRTERKSSTCDNHRGISLLSIAGKLMEKIY